MRISDAAARKFLAAPDPAIRAILLYGPDQGLVRERAERFAAAVAGDLHDPFRVSVLEAADLRDDPARLEDEARALSMTGGRRVVRLRDAADSVAPLLEAVLREDASEALVVAEAGDLRTSSRLRKLFEGTRNVYVLACYPDEGATLEGVIRNALREEGLEIEADALAWLTGHAGADRMVTRRELEKLVIYMGAGDGKESPKVTLADVEAAVGDSAELDPMRLAQLTADGDLPALDRDLGRLAAMGESPVGLLRGVLRHFLRLSLAAAMMERGQGATEALAALRPPVFERDKPAFRRHLSRWPAPALDDAVHALNDAERLLKATGMPGRAVLGQALYALAIRARDEAGGPPQRPLSGS